MIDIEVTDQWRKAFPGAQIGILLMGNVDNTNRPSPLDDLKKNLVSSLRSRYEGHSRADLLEMAVLRTYRSYYGNFGNTYHVQLQLESILHKEKSLPSVSPLVDAVFAAEMETLLLTAGHDADQLCAPVKIDMGLGTEKLIRINGTEKTIKAGDMMMTDAKGVVCTILYGQDRRTPISPKTRRALYVTYVPAGVEADMVSCHLETIKRNILLFSPEAEMEYQTLLRADGN